MKSGFLTSEFWLHLLATVVPFIGAALLKSDNPAVVAAATAVAAVANQVAAVKYASNRTDLKMAAADAAKAAATGLVQAAASVVTQPAFDQNVFGGMTVAEKAAAASSATPSSK